ncbi:MAG TPA: SRPBCC domain-containing protein [Acidimicrobiales bacterium]
MTPPDPSAPIIEPVRMTVRVRRNIEDAFDIFTRDIGSWWPLDRFSFDTERSRELHLEPFEGGRFYERYRDGVEHDNGRVLRWEPPRLVAYAWRHDDWSEATEVEVKFIAEQPKLTRVELEHRAWERLGVEGANWRDMYNNGWPTVIRCFASFAGVA